MTEHYTIDDFIEDLKKKRIHQRRTQEDGTSGIGIRRERAIRQQL
jgi:hypothetical protein